MGTASILDRKFSIVVDLREVLGFQAGGLITSARLVHG